jgi:hypothetical protein
MNLKAIAAAATLACAAAASAQEIPLAQIPLTLVPTGANTSVATFERTVNGAFLDSFTFSPASFAGTVSVSLMPLSGPINFTVALLNDQPFSFFPESGQSTFAFQADVSADMPLSLVVLGFSGDAETFTAASGRYGGTVTAIPEPGTYALLLGGLAALGVMNRRRQRRLSA